MKGLGQFAIAIRSQAKAIRILRITIRNYVNKYFYGELRTLALIKDCRKRRTYLEK